MIGGYFSQWLQPSEKKDTLVINIGYREGDVLTYEQITELL
jgi:hypothetical protein